MDNFGKLRRQLIEEIGGRFLRGFCSMSCGVCCRASLVPPLCPRALVFVSSKFALLTK